MKIHLLAESFLNPVLATAMAELAGSSTPTPRSAAPMSRPRPCCPSCATSWRGW
jgi:hypothetical protein